MQVIDITIERIPDWDVDDSYLKQDGFEDRRAEYENGGFGHIGIRAVAQVNINDTVQTIKSPGLWGIEDDSGDEYFAEVEQEQRDELAAILKEMGV